MGSPVIYNLFPRLVGHMGRWPAHAGRARNMGFNWLFLNPIQYPGFSGSLYAVKDFYRINPLFVLPEAQDAMLALRQTLESFHDQGLRVMMDLVINHSAKDSDLVRSHPSWFRRDARGDVVSPSAIDPADARKITVWGDLAEIDNANSPDREGLWAYWTAMLQYHLDLGFDGFRCDAAYKVPRRLWEQLIGVARRRNPSVVFAAETLGCRLAEVRQLRGAGFDYLFNSSKWWHFDAAWCLEQHEEFQEVAPSISFPESHDTERLMEETEGMVPVQKQRYAFAALFSEGLLMPLGYEFGFRKALNVVRTTPEDWEETGLDLSSFITEMNRIKTAVPVFGVEGHFAVLTTLDGPTMVLLKSAPGLGSAAVLVNKDWYSPQRMVLPRFGVDLPEPRRLLRPFSEGLPSPWPADGVVHLQPAEVALVVGADRS